MALIKSISGIRGTIGGAVGNNLTPVDAVKFAAAYGTWLKLQPAANPLVVVGRDARISGAMLNDLIKNTLIALGLDVYDLGLASTPTVEIAVPLLNAGGGIILTASHNPANWNALKLLNSKGEFISAADGMQILDIADSENFEFADYLNTGKCELYADALIEHISQIMKLPLVDVAAIQSAGFRVALDAVNSVGGIAIVKLLQILGVAEIIELNCVPDGRFAHNPEPLPENLTEIVATVKAHKVDVGFVVDPDVDRLAIINEDGTFFGEEYTLVAVADYILQHTAGNTVSNLSSTRALKDITLRYGGSYSASAVGEVNVVEMMKATNAVIGGEGNGGIIYPALHYGRDSLVGVALFLSHLAKSGKKCSELRACYPDYFMSKNKIELPASQNADNLLLTLIEKYSNSDAEVNTTDGLKISFATEWVHLRKSNTEPIIRIYTESTTQANADKLAQTFVEEMKHLFV